MGFEIVNMWQSLGKSLKCFNLRRVLICCKVKENIVI